MCKIEANHPTTSRDLKRFVVQFDSSWILEVDGRCLFSCLLCGPKVRASVVTRDIAAYEFYLFKKLHWQTHCFSVFE